MFFHDPPSQTSRVTILNFFNGARNSDKSKNPTATIYGGFSSLSTGAVEILIFVILRVPLVFLFHVTFEDHA